MKKGWSNQAVGGGFDDAKSWGAEGCFLYQFLQLQIYGFVKEHQQQLIRPRNAAIPSPAAVAKGELRTVEKPEDLLFGQRAAVEGGVI